MPSGRHTSGGRTTKHPPPPPPNLIKDLYSFSSICCLFVSDSGGLTLTLLVVRPLKNSYFLCVSLLCILFFFTTERFFRHQVFTLYVI